MKSRLTRIGASLVFALAASAAFAHAQLESAAPPVGGTVSAPSEIRLTFSEGVEPKFSGLTLTALGGAKQPVGSPHVQPGDNHVLIVKVGKTLAPGAYTVQWRAVSVDTHHTQGSFDFTVK